MQVKYNTQRDVDVHIDYYTTEVKLQNYELERTQSRQLKSFDKVLSAGFTNVGPVR